VTERISLELGEDEFLSSSDLTISADGGLLAYCKIQFAESGSTRALVIRTVAPGSKVVEMPIDPVYGGCRPSAFNADASQLVLGLAMESYFDPNAASGVPSWRTQVLDVRTAEVLHEINSDSLDTSVLDNFGRGNVPMMADVIAFHNNLVTFRGIPYVGMEIPADIPAWLWDLSSGNTRPLENIGRMRSDFLYHTGEAVYPALDESLDAAIPNNPVSLANVVRIQDDRGVIKTIYQNEEDVVVATNCVMDGQAVAVTLLGGFDENRPGDMSSIHFVLVDRSGAVRDLGPDYEQYAQIGSFPGGAVVASSEIPDQGTPIAHLALTQGDGLDHVWEYQPVMENGYSFLELVWTPQVEVAGTLPPFTAVQ
jgi:hypothetical protein